MRASSSRLRERGHSLDEIRKAVEEGRLAYGFVEDLFPSPRRRHSIEEVAKQTGLEKALIERIWTTIGLPAARRRGLLGRGRAGPPLRRVGARRRLPARRLPPAHARVRPDAVSDRRRRDAPLPHLRARAADARGRARRGDGRGDGAPRARPAAARLADHGLHPPPLPPALRRAGRGRPHGGGPRARTQRARPRARGASPSATSPATRASPRRRARRRRSRSSSASSSRSRRRCPTTPAW